MRLLQKLRQSQIPAQHRIDSIVVVGVVTVVRRRLKNGVEVQCVNPEILEVVELLDDT